MYVYVSRIRLITRFKYRRMNYQPIWLLLANFAQHVKIYMYICDTYTSYNSVSVHVSTSRIFDIRVSQRNYIHLHICVYLRLSWNTFLLILITYHTLQINFFLLKKNIRYIEVHKRHSVFLKKKTRKKIRIMESERNFTNSYSRIYNDF